MNNRPTKKCNAGEQKALDIELALVAFPHISSVKELLEKGANPNGATAHGKSSLLHAAVLRNEEELVKLLLQHGADVDAPGETNKTVLGSLSVFTGQNIASLLINSKKDVRARDAFGWSTFDHACKLGSLSLAKSLHEQGADPFGVNNEGFQPIHVAALNGQTEVCRFLLDIGADPNACARKNKDDAHSTTPLLEAAMNGRTETCLLLMQHGADPSFVHKRSSVHAWAKRRGHAGTANAIQAFSASKKAQASMTQVIAKAIARK